MDLLLEPPKAYLPQALLDLNLLQVFIWYVTGLFLLSVSLRLRFYTSIYTIARYVAEACPNVFRLVHEHWFLCVRDRFLTLAGVYGGILAAYLLLSRIVWPRASVSPQELADWHPAVLTVMLIMIGLMVTVDLVLTLQTSVIEEDRIIQDLKFAEGWLGGRLYQVLQMLGKWNPIKNYADNLTAETMLWMNTIFRGSVRSMILQSCLRVIVGTMLFASHAILRPT